MCRLALDLGKKPWELAWALWAGNAKVPGRRRAKARPSKAQAQGTTQVYMEWPEEQVFVEVYPALAERERHMPT